MVVVEPRLAVNEVVVMSVGEMKRLTFPAIAFRDAGVSQHFGAVTQAALKFTEKTVAGAEGPRVKLIKPELSVAFEDRLPEAPGWVTFREGALPVLTLCANCIMGADIGPAAVMELFVFSAPSMVKVPDVAYKSIVEPAMRAGAKELAASFTAVSVAWLPGRKLPDDQLSPADS